MLINIDMINQDPKNEQASSTQVSPKDQKSIAAERVAQVNDHLSQTSEQQQHTTARRRRKQKTDNALPADWSDIRGHLSTLRHLAATPDTTRTGYIRQKQAGKLWVRERVEQLFDTGSVREIGSATGSVEWKQINALREEPKAFTPSNNVQGFGKLRGREVVFTADDFSLRAGHADGALWAKTTYLEKLAVALKLPIIKLVDGSSGGGSVSTIRTEGYSYVPPFHGMDSIMKQLNGGIPNLGAVLGPAIGLGAARVVSCHFSVMAADIGSLFNAGPRVVAEATFEEDLSFSDLGGPGVHCTNGTIDNLAADETGAFEQLRTVLGYLPNCGTRIPPVVEAQDPVDRMCEDLRSIIPRRRERMYDSRRLVSSVVDKDSFFEIGPLWGRTVIVGLARLGGKPIGIVANNAEVLAGALDAAGSQKILRHLKFCDVFNLPIVQFVDVPGYAIGTVAEKQATMRWGVELTKTYYTTTVPIFSVIVRKAYGVAGSLMLEARDPHMRVGWPSGEWGSLPLDGGIEVGHSAELRKIEQERGPEARKARYKELDEEYRRLMNPVRTANHFSIEEIIDPADTRALVERWTRHTYKNDLPERVMLRLCGKLQPTYA
jgi:acetyl-CoA carboxylase carboxyltransferase component